MSYINSKKAELNHIIERGKYYRIKTERGYIPYHRYIMERNLGRYLWPFEHIHHINGNTHDNRIENLKVVTDSEHAKIHADRIDPHIEVKVIYDYLNTNLSIRESAEIYGIGQRTINSVITKYNLNNFKRAGCWTKITHNMGKEILKLHESGLSSRKIGKKVGVNGQTILNYLNKKGIKTGCKCDSKLV